MKKSSINIEPVKPGSEAHNFRLKKLHYVRNELTHLNESWSSCTIAEKRETIKEAYSKSVNQKMQSKSTPIREGVFLFDEHHTIEDAAQMADQIERRFGIRTFQIHMHRDEGKWVDNEGDYVSSKDCNGNEKWEPNLHGHILFDWTELETGKTLKLDRDDMAQIQTLIAKSLGMERGESSDVRHLNAVQWKTKKEKENLNKVKQEKDSIEQLLKLLESNSCDIIALNSFRLIDKEKTLKNIQALYFEIQNLKTRLLDTQRSKSAQKELATNFEKRYLEVSQLLNKCIKDPKYLQELIDQKNQKLSKKKNTGKKKPPKMDL